VAVNGHGFADVIVGAPAVPVRTVPFRDSRLDADTATTSVGKIALRVIDAEKRPGNQAAPFNKTKGELRLKQPCCVDGNDPEILVGLEPTAAGLQIPGTKAMS
jgi:hypothetical protein